MCGIKLEPKVREGKSIPWCKEHGGDFRSPTVAANILVPTTDGGVILVRSAEGWACPGGFSDTNEMPENTAIREAFEEVGLHLEIECELMHYILEDINILVFYYLAKPVHQLPVAGDDADEARVFYPSKENMSEFIPPHWGWHLKAIDAWQNLKSGAIVIS